MRHWQLFHSVLALSVCLAGCSVGDLKKQTEDAARQTEDAARKAAADVEKKGNSIEVKIGDGNLTLTPGKTETKGPRGTPGPFEQMGEFRALKATTGDVVFPIPYEKAPDVELKSKLGPHSVELVELKTTGFKWKNNGKRDFLDEPDMLFTARGVPIPGQDLKAFTQMAEFKADSGASGEVKFADAYAAPPHVELVTKFGLHKVVITETTPAGFRWTNHGKRGFVDNADMSYTARGVKAR